MPDNGDSEYPPQAVSSSLTDLLGQFNDFVGVPPPPPPPDGVHEMKSAKGVPSKGGPSPADNLDIAKKIAAGDFVFPVSIVGSKGIPGPYLPGLKDVLIATSIIRLAEQIVTPGQKAVFQKQAYELMHAGNTSLAAHIAKQRKGGKK